MRKFCDKEITKHEGWYEVDNTFYCQQCDGIIVNKDYVMRIIEFNKIRGKDGSNSYIRNK
ncbi:MAG: hypothetical protein BWY04_01386 [candidate division CPR1 bacterium ADurb.Bin160]|uniref:Uncharacterized protein n=1 Tax=candidate division CPR1 bacterium ADurb.Bin160 TaxID=1852826 RepID=A0A1V5ZJC8_9BACT|nr:MAG: hypothetical protein BWY04_01386 [candidate division CPR1 bacterium ADurb.Bin160]